MAKKDFSESFIELYKLNIETLDSQHFEGLSILYEMKKHINDGETSEQYHKNMPELISRIYQYARFHLPFEEKFLESIDYPYLEEHKNQHKILYSRITGFFDDYSRNGLISDEDLLQFVELWLKDHIKDHDKKFADYIALNNIDCDKYLK